MSRLSHAGLLLLGLLVPRRGVPQGVSGSVGIDANVIGQAVTVTTLALEVEPTPAVAPLR